MNEKKRIVITGMGTKNAIGGSIPEFARSLEEGVCGIAEIDLFDTGEFRTHKGGQVKDFDPRRSMPEEYYFIGFFGILAAIAITLVWQRHTRFFH